MANSHLQDASVRIEKKICFKIYLIMPKSFLQDMFLEHKKYKFYKFRNYEIIAMIMLSQQKRRLTIGNCTPPEGG